MALRHTEPGTHRRVVKVPGEKPLFGEDDAVSLGPSPGRTVQECVAQSTQPVRDAGAHIAATVSAAAGALATGAGVALRTFGQRLAEGSVLVRKILEVAPSVISSRTARPFFQAAGRAVAVGAAGASSASAGSVLVRGGAYTLVAVGGLTVSYVGTTYGACALGII